MLSALYGMLMKYFWFFLYNILFLPLFWIYVHAASLFNPKIKRGLKKRRTWQSDLKYRMLSLDSQKKNVLIQCSSLGEFHEARPVIEELNKTGNYNFIISFFSTSGYDNFDPTSGSSVSANVSTIIKTLLPFDSFTNVRKFISLTNPYAVLFVKYDLWYNLLWELNRKSIYSAVINTKYRRDEMKWSFGLRSFFITMYNFLNVVVTANKYSEKCYRKILSENVEVIDFGDTKVDYIIETAGRQNGEDIINESLVRDKTVIVAGSTWKADEDLLLHALNKICLNSNGVLAIIAPHEPHTGCIAGLEEKLRDFSSLNAIRLSNLRELKNENVIIVDSIGLLFGLYKHADIAYVGGGFGSGVHNVLEPARYSLPILFGNESLSEDARSLMRGGSAIGIGNVSELYDNLAELIVTKEKRKELGVRSNAVFENRTYASKKIAELITEI